MLPDFWHFLNISSECRQGCPPGRRLRVSHPLSALPPGWTYQGLLPISLVWDRSPTRWGLEAAGGSQGGDPELEQGRQDGKGTQFCGPALPPTSVIPEITRHSGKSFHKAGNESLNFKCFLILPNPFPSSQQRDLETKAVDPFVFSCDESGHTFLNLVQKIHWKTNLDEVLTYFCNFLYILNYFNTMDLKNNLICAEE